MVMGLSKYAVTNINPEIINDGRKGTWKVYIIVIPGYFPRK